MLEEVAQPVSPNRVACAFWHGMDGSEMPSICFTGLTTACELAHMEAGISHAGKVKALCADHHWSCTSDPAKKDYIPAFQWSLQYFNLNITTATSQTRWTSENKHFVHIVPRLFICHAWASHQIKAGNQIKQESQLGKLLLHQFLEHLEVCHDVWLSKKKWYIYQPAKLSKKKNLPGKHWSN